MTIFKINAEEVAILRDCASRESGPHIPTSRIKLEPGIRRNTETDRGTHMNIALVSDDPNWDDTDLDDYGEWMTFKKGVELTEDGRGIFDFYIRKQGDPDGELCGNVSIIVKNGRMVKVHGYGGDRPFNPLSREPIGELKPLWEIAA